MTASSSHVHSRLVLLEGDSFAGKLGYSGSQPGLPALSQHNIGMLIVVPGPGAHLNLSLLGLGKLGMLTEIDKRWNRIVLQLDTGAMLKKGWWELLTNFASQAAKVMSQGKAVVVCPAKTTQLLEAPLICAALANRLYGSQPEDTMAQINKALWDSQVEMLFDDFRKTVLDRMDVDGSKDRNCRAIHIYIYIYV